MMGLWSPYVVLWLEPDPRRILLHFYRQYFLDLFSCWDNYWGIMILPCLLWLLWPLKCPVNDGIMISLSCPMAGSWSLPDTSSTLQIILLDLISSWDHYWLIVILLCLLWIFWSQKRLWMMGLWSPYVVLWLYPDPRRVLLQLYR